MLILRFFRNYFSKTLQKNVFDWGMIDRIVFVSPNRTRNLIDFKILTQS